MITIDWPAKIISVPQAYLTFVSGSLYELDVNQFRLDLKDLEDDVDGMAFLDTHRHNTTVTLSGITYARTFEIINGYTVTFEYVAPGYAISCVGANHNIADVMNINGVTLIIGNSAGLVQGAGAEAVWAALAQNQNVAGSMAQLIKVIQALSA